MNLTDLRDELTTHADDLGTATDLRAGVAAKVTQTKRRRAAAVGAGATLAVAALAVGVVTFLGRPSPDRPRGYAVEHGPDDRRRRHAVPHGAGRPGDIVKDGLRYGRRVGATALAVGSIGDLGRASRRSGSRRRPTSRVTVECYVPGRRRRGRALDDLMVRARVGAMKGYVSMSCSNHAAQAGDLPVGGPSRRPGRQGWPS